MLRHKKDLRNALRGFTAPLLFFPLFYAAPPPRYEFLVAALLWLVLSDINHILHLHGHHAFFKNKLLTRILDLSGPLQFRLPPYASLSSGRPLDRVTGHS